MSEQGLFDCIAPSRNSDPITSHRAAARVVESGSAETHAEIVLDFLKAHGPATYHEIASRTRIERHEVMRRLNNPLEKHGAVYKRGTRVCCCADCVRANKVNVITEWSAR